MPKVQFGRLGTAALIWLISNVGCEISLAGAAIINTGSLTTTTYLWLASAFYLWLLGNFVVLILTVAGIVYAYRYLKPLQQTKGYILVQVGLPPSRGIRASYYLLTMALCPNIVAVIATIFTETGSPSLLSMVGITSTILLIGKAVWALFLGIFGIALARLLRKTYLTMKQEATIWAKTEQYDAVKAAREGIIATTTPPPPTAPITTREPTIEVVQPTVEETNQCELCESERRAGAKFCAGCGRKLTVKQGASWR
jgi:hypothetical protein